MYKLYYTDNNYQILQVTPNCSKEEITYEVEFNGQYSNDTLLLQIHSGSSKKHVVLTSENITKDELYVYSVRIKGVQDSASTRAVLSMYSFVIETHVFQCDTAQLIH